MENIGETRIHGLSASDTRWLIGEAQRVLTGLGRSSSVVDGVALSLVDGRVMGLDNLARALRLLPRTRWARAVRDQITALIDCAPDEEVATADLRAKLWLREQADGFLEYEPIEPLPGVVAVLAAQRHRMTHMFGRLDTVGDRDEAYATALTNLTALPLPRHTRRRVDPRNPTSWVEFLDSSDSFGAARVLVLPELLRRVLRSDFPADGVLVAVPTKFELWVHVPVDESVFDTALTMSWLSLKTCSEEPYPVSPDVFLVSPDMHAARLVAPDQDGCDISQGPMLELLHAMHARGLGREAS